MNTGRNPTALAGGRFNPPRKTPTKPLGIIILLMGVLLFVSSTNLNIAQYTASIHLTDQPELLNLQQNTRYPIQYQYDNPSTANITITTLLTASNTPSNPSTTITIQPLTVFSGILWFTTPDMPGTFSYSLNVYEGKGTTNKIESKEVTVVVK